MAYRKGEVVLVNYPYTDMSALKVRPAVIISGAQYQQTQPDLMFSALTTNLASATDFLDYILLDWEAAGLKRPTAFKPVIATLEPSLIEHSIGYLSLRDLAEVDARLRYALELGV